MNKKGQSALDLLMEYGWVIIVIGIEVGVLVFVVIEGEPSKPSERWEEQWECTQTQETGELVNCREERIIETWTPGEAGIEYQRVVGTEIVCDKETRCVAQARMRCLITPELGEDLFWRENRECDEANGK